MGRIMMQDGVRGCLLTSEGDKSVKDKKRRFQYGKACRY
jgi:hypothetical protein